MTLLATDKGDDAPTPPLQPETATLLPALQEIARCATKPPGGYGPPAGDTDARVYIAFECRLATDADGKAVWRKGSRHVGHAMPERWWTADEVAAWIAKAPRGVIRYAGVRPYAVGALVVDVDAGKDIDDAAARDALQSRYAAEARAKIGGEAVRARSSSGKGLHDVFRLDRTDGVDCSKPIAATDGRHFGEIIHQALPCIVADIDAWLAHARTLQRTPAMPPPGQTWKAKAPPKPQRSRHLQPGERPRPSFTQLLACLEGVQHKSESHFMARCPGHDDRVPSLRVTRADDGSTTWYCHAACKGEDRHLTNAIYTAVYGPAPRKGRRREPPKPPISVYEEDA